MQHRYFCQYSCGQIILVEPPGDCFNDCMQTTSFIVGPQDFDDGIEKLHHHTAEVVC